MYVKPPEIVQPQQQSRRVVKRGDSIFQEELIEATDMIDSIHFSDKKKDESKQQLSSKNKNQGRGVTKSGKIDIEA